MYLCAKVWVSKSLRERSNRHLDFDPRFYLVNLKTAPATPLGVGGTKLWGILYTLGVLTYAIIKQFSLP